MPNNILQGDVIEKLKEIETGTVQCVVTSPPYWGLRDYGTASWEGGDDDCNHQVGRFEYSVSNKQKSNSASASHQASVKCPKCGSKRIDQQLGLEETPEEYVEKMVEVFRQIKRVLKHDGTVWLNLGDSYNGSGKGAWDKTDVQKEVYVPPKGTPVTRVKSLKPKDLVGIPWRVAFALQADGWYLRQDIIWHKPNPMPESVTDRCTKSHEYIFLLTKSAKYFYDNDAIRKPLAESTVGRYEYGWSGNTDVGNIKASHSGIGKFIGSQKSKDTIITGRNKRSVWKINTKPYKEAHFAVFPPKLPELCIKAGSSEGDIVLDPFFGSGTTGWVAQRLGRKWIGIELNEEYIKIAEKRFQQRELFVA